MTFISKEHRRQHALYHQGICPCCEKPFDTSRMLQLSCTPAYCPITHRNMGYVSNPSGVGVEQWEELHHLAPKSLDDSEAVERFNAWQEKHMIPLVLGDMRRNVRLAVFHRRLDWLRYTEVETCQVKADSLCSQGVGGTPISFRTTVPNILDDCLSSTVDASEVGKQN